MKKLLFFIINFCFVAAMGQNLIAPIIISLPANPPANTADWATAMPPVMINAQTKMPNGQISPLVIESKILVTIKSGGSIICGSYNPQTAPQSNFNSVTKTWSGAAVLSLLGKDCILKPGTYELCVQFYGLNAAQGGLLGEACKSFTIADTKQERYSPPQNIVPVNGKVFTEQEAGMPIMLRWTPVVPKPQGDVLYKVRLIEILPGQNKTEALRTNTPIDVLEVKNQTQTSAKLSKRCNNCEYVWNVEASKKSAMGDIEMLGTSEATSFSVKPGDTNPEKFNPPVNQLPVDGKVFTKEEIDQPIRFTWSPVIPTPKEPVLYKVRVVEIKKGQPMAEALRTNTPTDIFEVKNSTQTTAKLSKRCNNCEYIWNVEAIGTERVQGGNPKNYGSSEPTSFGTQSPCSPDYEFISDSVYCGADGKIHVKGHIKITPKPSITISQISLTQIKETNYSGANVSTNIATLPQVLSVNGNNYYFDLIINSDMCNKQLYLGYTIKYFCSVTGQNMDLPCGDSIPNLPCCICDPCKTLGVTIRNDRLTSTGSTSGQILLSGILSGLDPNVVKKVTMELVYYNIEQTGDENCVQCAENKEWGNFIKPASHYFSNYNQGILNGINFGREWTWLSKVKKECDNHGNGGVGDGHSGPLNTKCTTCGTTTSLNPSENQNNTFSQVGFSTSLTPIIIQPPFPRVNTFSLPIAVPPGSSLKCCSDKIKVCIRYTIWDFCCKACDIVKCYEIDRKAQ
ncbi:MAG: hypothetical protein IPL84_15950 [Chitinophagaceae bacterium]|nr:hypothetical protein [Chitinophagaceae bacterium]